MAFERPVIVIDNGSYITKAGFACDNHPVSMFRTVVGRPNFLSGSYGREFYDVFIGDDAMERTDELEICKPVVNGRVVHWDNLERIWHHIFYRELKAAPEDRSVILACSVTTPMADKIKFCEIFFETLNIPGLCVQTSAVLSLYGSGYTTGISVDLGYDTADICPVYEGGLITYAHMRTNYSESKVSDFFKISLDERNIRFEGTDANDIIEGMKKKMYLTQNIAMSRRDYKKMYTLPSGEQIEISQEAFMAAEMIFNPVLVSATKASPTETDVMPLQDAIIVAASKCDADLRGELYEAIVPCGGMSTIPGLNSRLEAEIEEVIHRPVNVLSSSESYTVAWLGGATFAGMPAAKKLWLSKKQYDEYGSKIIRNKFM